MSSYHRVKVILHFINEKYHMFIDDFLYDDAHDHACENRNQCNSILTILYDITSRTENISKYDLFVIYNPLHICIHIFGRFYQDTLSER